MRTFPILSGIATDPNYPPSYRAGTSVPLRTTLDGKLVPDFSGQALIVDPSALAVLTAGNYAPIEVDNQGRLLTRGPEYSPGQQRAHLVNTSVAATRFTQITTQRTWVTSWICSNSGGADCFGKLYDSAAAILGTSTVSVQTAMITKSPGAQLISTPLLFVNGLAAAFTALITQGDTTVANIGADMEISYMVEPSP